MCVNEERPGGVMGGVEPNVKKRALVRWQSTGEGGCDGLSWCLILSMCGRRIRAAEEGRVQLAA